jgi:two-component system phosphate regulon sensor histidine kinase PhoR
LRKTLDFYNIDQPYQMCQSAKAPALETKSETPMCVVNIPPHVDQQESFVTLSFPEKDNFMLSKIRYMIVTSIFILLFTAIVLLLANYWLLKQKRLLTTNSEIYNNMAHEFRTPLTNIQLAANLLAKDPTSPSKDKFLEVIQKENSRLIQQVERVLHVARLDNGDYSLKNEAVDIVSLFDAVVEDMHMRIEEKNATVIIDPIPADLAIHGDRLHLTNVFRNLMDNALKYSTEKPEIRIAAREEKDGILISIEDNGIGIPASQSQLIFEKFQRIRDGRIDEERGFGLGLSYVKRIVELHKGFIQLDCGVQQGSRFNVFLPKFC